MAERLHKISFVSGKGGVGKTALAANFAWICAHFAKTLLVDLDFQNQGTTGLFCSYFPQECRGALDHLFKPNQLAAADFVRLDANLYFIPAVPLQNPPKHSDLFELCQRSDFAPRLESLLDTIGEDHGFEIVVLDCHGGLDTVSLAAHRLSDHTLVVTEADRVTFNGTLELLDFYQVAAPSAKAAAAAFSERLQVHATPQMRTHPVELIVNRIPPKYRWDDLNRVYERMIAAYKTELNIADKILAYIPNEESVSETFGEVPFLAKVAPNAVLTQKLQLLAYKLFASAFEFPDSYKPLTKLKSERRRTKLDRVLASTESRNIRAIVVTFALIANGYVLLFLGTASAVALATWSSKYGIFLGIAAFVYFILVSISILRAAFGLKRYYQDKYQIQRNMIKVSQAGPYFWQRISMIKLLFLRLATWVLPYVVILTLPLFLYLGVLVLALGASSR